MEAKSPDINIEIGSDNRFTDIVAERFDIGVRLGGDIAKDMIAVRMSSHANGGGGFHANPIGSAIGRSLTIAAVSLRILGDMLP
jgi:DNA-binding transcriptional LysR family regulator